MEPRGADVKGKDTQSSMIWFLQMAQLSTRMSHAQIETADHCRTTKREHNRRSTIRHFEPSGTRRRTTLLSIGPTD